MEEERQLRAVRKRVLAAAIPETVVESGEEAGSQQGSNDPGKSIDVMIQDELEIKRQREEEDARQLREKEMMEGQILEYEQEKEREQQEDEARYEELQAQYVQEWDDWVMWRSLHATSPSRTRPAKKQKMVLHVQVQGELTPVPRLDFNVTPGLPTTIGLTWTVLDDDPGIVEDNAAKASGSQSSTERVSPVTPETQTVKPVVKGQGHIADGELSAFMTGEEGRSVFQAWCSGGFHQSRFQGFMRTAF